jgi:hypothetical protein
MLIFKVVQKGQNYNCYLNELGEVWIIEQDFSETSSSRFIRQINSIEEAKIVALDILSMSGR